MPETQDPDSLPGVLADIVRTKHSELDGLRARARQIDAALTKAPPVRDFARALGGGDHVSLIAECKRRSPGAGAIRPQLDPVLLTTGYEQAGAAALSVLTDSTYFGGSNADLTAIRATTSIPILRKDFTLDALHVREARSAGADAVLLIVRILSDESLKSLFAEATALGMSVLVETHDANELERAVRVGARVIGINNRDLATFTTDLDTTLRLLEQVSDEAIIVSESGIRDRDDVARLGDAGVDAILVGETLLRAGDPTEAAAGLSRVPRAVRTRA